MRKTIKYIPIAALLILLAGTFSSCEKDDKAAAPTIEYVRSVTAEEPITYANLGETVAIVGTGLGSTKQILFNGNPAHFYRTMAQDGSLVVNVPQTTPFDGENATSELTVETEGGIATFNFEIAPPAPEVTGFSPEYAGVGAEITIQGSYFYNIESVTFAGGANAEIVSFSPTAIKVKVPQGYQKGKVSVVSSRSGAGNSATDFGLSAGDIVTNWTDIAPTNGMWWNNATEGPIDDFANLGTPYKYIDATFGGTWWTHDGGIQFDQTAQRSGIPATKALKFEYANTGDVPWIQILWKSSLGEYKFIVSDFEATGGQWKTYTIKMDSFTLGDGGPAMTQEVFEADSPVLVQFAFVNAGDSEINTKFGMTNFRIVNE